jgi:hypothetical protein
LRDAIFADLVLQDLGQAARHGSWPGVDRLLEASRYCVGMSEVALRGLPLDREPN